MAAVYTYKGGQRPIIAGGKHSLSPGTTNPAKVFMTYNTITSAIGLTDDDANGNNLNDYWPQPRHGTLQVSGGTIRYTFSGETPTATIGTLVADGGEVEFENQPELMKSFQMILASGTPTVTIEPLG